MVAAFEVPFEEGLEKYDRAIDEAEADVIKAGLGVTSRPMRHNKPAERPTIPEDLSELGLAELSNLLGVMTRWHSYAIGQKVIAGNQRDAAAEKKAFAWKYIRRLKEGTVSDKDDSAGIDVRYVDVEAQYRYHDAKYTFLVGMVDSLKRETETISRAVELLRQRIEIEGRNVGVGRHADRQARREEQPAKHASLSNLFRSRPR
jgi:hypothetical protein